MFRIEKITTDPLQTQSLQLPDGTKINLTLYFVPMQYGWFIKELKYGDFVLNNLRITNGANILRQYKNQIPFGLGCVSDNDREPSQQQDFSSEASKLYILDAADVELYEDYLSGKV